MKNKTTVYLVIMVTILNLLISACGTANANGGYRLEFMFGYDCITNDVSIWCDNGQ